MKQIKDMSNSLLKARQDADPFRFLIGKQIASVRYSTESECESLGWSKRPLIIIFKDGTKLIPQCDDEGNNGGAMWYQDSFHNQDTIIYTQ